MRFFFFILLTVSACAQSVGDFSISYKANPTGPQPLKSWAKANSTLWGTDGSGNPQSITIGSGLSLTSGVLTSSGGGGVGTGTVTSVALTMPNIFSVTGSPITASGTLAASLATQSANVVFAGPTTGSAAAPTFRALVAEDIPDLSGTYQSLAAPLTTLATGFGSIFAGTGIIKWNGTSYELLSGYTPTTAGGTGIGYYVLGDMLYSSGNPTTLSKLSGNTSTTKKFLTQTGAGLESAAPAWGTIQAADVPTLNQNTTGNAGTATALATGRTLAITGDLTWTSPSFDGSGNVTATGTLAATGVSAGSFGNSTKSPSLTVDAKGRLTAAGEQTITPAVGSITGLGTGIATALAINTGSAGAPVLFNGAGGTPSSITLTNGTALPVSGITSSTSAALGLGSIELGHASDTTIARSSAGNITVEGQTIYRAGGSFIGIPVEIVIACSDETTALTTGTAKVTFRMPHAMTVTSVRLQVNTAPTGSVIIVDLKEAGTTVFSTKPQIAISAFTSVGGAVPGTLSDTSLADDAEITINLDQIGSTIAGKGLKVTLIGTR